MDACFEVLVETFRPHSSMRRQRNVAEWEGREHVQGSDTFQWGEHVLLKTLSEPLPSFLNDRLPRDLQETKWDRLQIEGDVLDQLAFEATGGEVEPDGQTLGDLLTLLLDDRESWLIVFLPQWDQLDEVIELDAADVTPTLRAGFAGTARGFLGVHRRKPA